MRWHLHWLSRTQRLHCLDHTTSTASSFWNWERTSGGGHRSFMQCPTLAFTVDVCFQLKNRQRVVHAATATCLQCKFLLHLQRWQAEEPRVVHVMTTTRIHCNWGGICRHTGGGSRILWQWPTGRYACSSCFIDMPRSLKRSPQLHVTHSINMAAYRHGSAEVEFAE